MNPTVGHGDKKESEAAHSAGYAPYPKLTPEDVAPASVAATTMPPESNPYIISSPAPAAKSMFDFPISISKSNGSLLLFPVDVFCSTNREAISFLFRSFHRIYQIFG